MPESQRIRKEFKTLLQDEKDSQTQLINAFYSAWL